MENDKALENNGKNRFDVCTYTEILDYMCECLKYVIAGKDVCSNLLLFDVSAKAAKKWDKNPEEVGELLADPLVQNARFDAIWEHRIEIPLSTNEADKAFHVRRIQECLAFFDSQGMSVVA